MYYITGRTYVICPVTINGLVKGLAMPEYYAS